MIPENNATKIVNVKKDPYDVYIGRGSAFGNPYSHLKYSKAQFIVDSREESIVKYKEWFYEQLKDPEFLKLVLSLKGKTLGCYCKPKNCHGDIIVEYLNSV